MARGEGEGGRVFVLHDVPALQASGAVHRDEPASDPAQQRDRVADQPEHDLARLARLRAEVLEQTADEIAGMPLLGLDDADPIALLGVADALPMTAIRVARGELAGVRAAEDVHEAFAGAQGGPHLTRVKPVAVRAVLRI